jgi:hypothetical protein
MASPDKLKRLNLEKLSLDQLADQLGLPPSSHAHYVAAAELARRQALWQRDASEAMQASAKYMRWSVIAIAVTTSLVALFTFLLWWWP